MLMLPIGTAVITRVALDADAEGKDIPAGTKGVVHELPSTNHGMYSIAVGFDVYGKQSLSCSR